MEKFKYTLNVNPEKEFNHFTLQTMHNAVQNIEAIIREEPEVIGIVRACCNEYLETGKEVEIPYYDGHYISAAFDGNNAVMTISIKMEDEIVPVVATACVFSEEGADELWMETVNANRGVPELCRNHRPKAPFACDMLYPTYPLLLLKSLQFGEKWDYTAELFKCFYAMCFMDYAGERYTKKAS